MLVYICGKSIDTMMKRDTLYTINKWNKPIADTSKVYKSFDWGGPENSDGLGYLLYGTPYGDTYTGLGSRHIVPTDSSMIDNSLVNPMLTRALNTSGLSSSVRKPNTGFFDTKTGKTIKDNAGAIGTAIGALGNTVISDGFSTGVGNGVSGLGNVAGNIVSSFNPLLGGAISAASGIFGGLVNRAFGVKLNKENIAKVEGQIDSTRGAASGLSGLRNNDSLVDAWGNIDLGHDFTNRYIGRNGWFNHKADEKADELRDQQSGARVYATDNFSRSLAQADRLNDDRILSQSAFGGPIERNSLFALGGDMQTHGGDFSTGLTHIDAGGSHEENPYGGVQSGMDGEGVPNLVEEGEVIFNDYVYSDRIEADASTLKAFHLPKKKKVSYAKIAKQLESEITERPNDSKSRAAFKKMMEKLAEEQERQKAEMEAARAREAFEALSPEEQAALMQQMAAQEESTEEVPQYAGQEEGVAEAPQYAEQPMEQTVEEPTGQPVEQVMEQPVDEVQMSAYGGRKYANGGEKVKDAIYKLLGIHTDSGWDSWAEKNKVGKVDWENLSKNTQLLDALKKDNRVLADAIGRGYDFGVFQPSKSLTATFDNDRGNWDMQSVKGWWGSQDPAWLEVMKNHPEIKEDTVLDKKTLEKYLSSTEAFKKGTKWLQDSAANRLAYLQAIINNPNAPKKAKEYARKFATEKGWINGKEVDYNTIFNNPSGRAANPGTYWKTPIEAVRDKLEQNMFVNADGSIEELRGGTDGLSKVGSYSWYDPKTDRVVNYYKAKDTGANGSTEASPVDNGDDYDVEPIYRNENLRYAGLLGPGAALGLMAAGVGKPDTSGIDATLDASRKGRVALADYSPIYGRYEYRPYNPFIEDVSADQLSLSTDRAIDNAFVPYGSKQASRIANTYNNQIARGTRRIQGMDYNNKQRQLTLDESKDTQKFNSNAFNQVSQFNANALNRNKEFNATLGLQAAQEKMNADAGWNRSLYGNIGSLFKGIADVGRENYQHNMIADMAANGIFGTLTPNGAIGSRVLRWKRKDDK